MDEETKAQVDLLTPLIHDWGKEFFEAQDLDKKMMSEFDLAEHLIKGVESEKIKAATEFEQWFKSRMLSPQ